MTKLKVLYNGQKSSHCANFKSLKIDPKAISLNCSITFLDINNETNHHGGKENGEDEGWVVVRGRKKR